ncbi:MAG: ATP-dependent helicase, partial [Methanoregula sp.]|uniref:UvrD-helicase domain-containing protein n=1 Tax=Methanoregula sp. TaxID=2052170 RepID=UPI003C773FBD
MTIDLSQIDVIKLPIESSVFVTAPPGFGKTYLMTERISSILSKNIIRPPNKILALTFSNAAANELKDRVKDRIHEPEKYIDVMTFHTLAFFLLKIYGPLVGVKRNFLIVNENKIDECKKDFFQKYISQTNPSKKDDINELFTLIQNYDDWYKNKFIQLKDEKYQNPELFYQLNEKIRTEFVNDENLTFDFLLFKSIELLKTKPNLKEIYHKKYSLIFADEFQDTNYLQYMFLKEIAISANSRKRPVFVVGDKKQAIMKFQGANPENIEYLVEDFNCVKKELKKNHRTNSRLVLSLTNKLRNPTDEIPTDIKCKMYLHRTIEEETARLVEIVTQLKNNGTKLDDICILVPVLKTAIPIKKAFIERSIDFFIINEFKFDFVSENYPKIFTEFEKRIRAKSTRGSVSRVLSNVLKKFYAENMNEDPVLKNLQKFAVKFDSSTYK